MLRRNGQRLAKAHPVGLIEAFVAGAAFAFSGDQDDGLARIARNRCKILVGGRDAGAGVDHEQNHVRVADGSF